MLIPPKQFTEEGWKVTTVGDDIAWIKPDARWQIYAHQSRGRLLRRRPGHQLRRPIRTRWPRSSENTIFTNVALTDDGDVWWEGMDGEPPKHAIDWQGNDWTPADRSAKRPTRTPLHRADVAMPVGRSELQRPEGRADFGIYLRRTPQQRRCRSCRKPSIGPSAFIRPRRWARK